MLISLDYLIKKYKIPTRGVVHVGAHKAEEANVYADCGFKRVVWIEGNEALIPELEKKLEAYPVQKVYHALIDSEEKDTTFYITNDPQSSSIYDLKEHAKQYPGVTVDREMICRTIRLDNFFKTHSIQLSNYNFLNLDIQGNELNALKSLGKDLENFDFIYTEVQVTELYANSHTIHAIDKFLFSNNFQRAETDLKYRSWGDALYIKKEKVNKLDNLFKSVQSKQWELLWPAKKRIYRFFDQVNYILRTKIFKK